MKKKVYYRDLKIKMSPEEAYLRLTRGEEGILFESDEKDTGYTFICCSPKKVVARDRKIIEEIQKELMKTEVSYDERPYVGGAYGNISYDTIRDYEAVPEGNPKDIQVADSTMLITDCGMVFDNNEKTSYLTAVADSKEEGEEILNELEGRLRKEYHLHTTMRPLRGGFSSTPSKERFLKNVDRAKEYIAAGDIFQVVISQRFTQESSLHPFEFYNKLKTLNPSPYMFFLDFGTHQIVGSSPERMISLSRGVIKTVPIAGTRKRGRDAAEDEALAIELLSDEKERAEHYMLVDLARNDVGRVAKTGSVEVTELMGVKKFSHVMHLVSLVEGEIRKDEDVYSLIPAALPAGTLSGAPKIRAMEIIEELEDVRRGFYGGAIGYINYSGEMDTCIAIRTAMHREGIYTYQAGAGIVADSVPESEYKECINKGRSISKIFEEVCQ